MTSSCIKGKIFTDRIINKGGHIEGYIGKYAELLLVNPQLKSYTKNSVKLLESSDYYVNVEEEIKNKNSNSKKNPKEDEFYIDVEVEGIDDSKLFSVS
jgi:hypothetical protein